MSVRTSEENLDNAHEHERAGSKSDIGSTVLDVDAEIARFDVRHACCFKRTDRDRLLTVIEIGFGGLDAFNEVLRLLLQAAARQREKATSTRSALSARLLPLSPLRAPRGDCGQLSKMSGRASEERTCARHKSDRADEVEWMGGIGVRVGADSVRTVDEHGT